MDLDGCDVMMSNAVMERSEEFARDNWYNWI